MTEKHTDKRTILIVDDEKAAYYANKTLRKVQKKVGLTERIR